MNKMQALVRSEKNGRMSPLREKLKHPARIDERAEHSLTSEVKSNKSAPKPQTRKPGHEALRMKSEGMNKRVSHQ